MPWPASFHSNQARTGRIVEEVSGCVPTCPEAYERLQSLRHPATSRPSRTEAPPPEGAGPTGGLPAIGDRVEKRFGVQCLSWREGPRPARPPGGFHQKTGREARRASSATTSCPV